jgi:hypothetical protein
LAEDLPNLVAACQFSRRSGYVHGVVPVRKRPRILLDLDINCSPDPYELSTLDNAAKA